MEKDIKKIIEEIERRKGKKERKEGNNPVDITIKIKEDEERKGFGVESEITGGLGDIVLYMARGTGEILRGLFKKAELDEEDSRKLLAMFMTTIIVSERDEEEDD